jgi:hypothetical protein
MRHGLHRLLCLVCDWIPEPCKAETTRLSRKGSNAALEPGSDSAGSPVRLCVWILPRMAPSALSYLAWHHPRVHTTHGTITAFIPRMGASARSYHAWHHPRVHTTHGTTRAFIPRTCSREVRTLTDQIVIRPLPRRCHDFRVRVKRWGVDRTGLHVLQVKLPHPCNSSHTSTYKAISDCVAGALGLAHVGLVRQHRPTRSEQNSFLGLRE